MCSARSTGGAPALRDLGEVEVKHRLRVHIFNLCEQGAGNPEIPKKLQRATTRRRSAYVAIVALVLGVAVASWLLMYFGKMGPGKTRKSIAVLGFRNLTGAPNDEWMSTALSEQLTTELAAGEQLRALPGEDVIRAKLDLNLPETETLSQSTLAQLRKRLGSELVVMGSFYDRDGQVRVDIRLQDTSGGATANFSESGAESQYFGYRQPFGIVPALPLRNSRSHSCTVRQPSRHPARQSGSGPAQRPGPGTDAGVRSGSSPREI
jgi:TolB-like protein